MIQIRGESCSFRIVNASWICYSNTQRKLLISNCVVASWICYCLFDNYSAKMRNSSLSPSRFAVTQLLTHHLGHILKVTCIQRSFINFLSEIYSVTVTMSDNIPLSVEFQRSRSTSEPREPNGERKNCRRSGIDEQPDPSSRLQNRPLKWTWRLYCISEFVRRWWQTNRP